MRKRKFGLVQALGIGLMVIAFSLIVAKTTVSAGGPGCPGGGQPPCGGGQPTAESTTVVQATNDDSGNCPDGSQPPCGNGGGQPTAESTAVVQPTNDDSGCAEGHSCELPTVSPACGQGEAGNQNPHCTPAPDPTNEDPATATLGPATATLAPATATLNPGITPTATSTLDPAITPTSTFTPAPGATNTPAPVDSGNQPGPSGVEGSIGYPPLFAMLLVGFGLTVLGGGKKQ